MASRRTSGSVASLHGSNSNFAGGDGRLDCGFCGCVNQDKVVIVEQCGAFHSLAAPGYVCLACPCVWQMKAAVSTRIRQLNVTCETKTACNVFVHVVIGVQFCVSEGRAKDAYYKMSNPEGQIISYVTDVVRSSVPKMELDNVFVNKSMIADDIQSQLSEQMSGFGYKIYKALVIDISPATIVKQSMNEINANKRLRMAAFEKAEAEKMVLVKRAEAEEESKYLQGEGISRQRAAIVEGLRDSVGGFTKEVNGMSAKDVLELVMITNYFDTIQGLGANSNTCTVFVNHNPAGLSNTSNQVKQLFAK